MRSPLNSVTLSIVGESVGRFVCEKARGCLDDSTMDAMMKSVYAREMERCVGEELAEYNSLRKSLESSVSLFRSLRDELSSVKVSESV